MKLAFKVHASGLPPARVPASPPRRADLDGAWARFGVALQTLPTAAPGDGRAAPPAGATGDYDEVLRLIERYHRDFPRGTLAADADVVALEALAAKGDAAASARQAALFLARYPNDPHVARVRRLAGDRGTP